MNPDKNLLYNASYIQKNMDKQEEAFNGILITKSAIIQNDINQM